MVVHSPERELDEALTTPALYGVIGEFGTAQQLLQAARSAYAAGYRSMDAYSPFPIDGLGEALGSRSKAVPLIAICAGTIGAVSGFGMQFLIHVVALPINVGGRPLDSWQSFVPVTFELGVLFCALALFFGLLILDALPQPYHPVFNVAAFARASRDRFFLCIQADDPRFDTASAHRFLHELGASEVSDVPE